MEKFRKTIFSFWAAAFLLIVSSLKAQTPSGANGMVFRFTKQVWLNPTIILAKQNFEQSTNVKLLILPRTNSNDTVGNSKIEKAFDMLLSFLVYKENVQGSIKFYFNPKNPGKPFTFSTSEELSCKFTPIQKDSVEDILNRDIVNSSNLNNFTALPFDSIINRASRYCKRVLQSKPGPCGDNSGNEFKLTKINTTPARLNFERAVNPNLNIPNGGVDRKQYAELEQYYNTVLDVADNSSYPMAWKAMTATGNDAVKLKLQKKLPGFDLSRVVFKNADGSETYNVTYNNIDRDSTIGLGISGKSPGTMAEVVAYYTPTTTPTQTFAIGAFNVQFYEPKTLNVVLVNLGGITLPDANAIKDTLNKIYGQAFIKWNVTTVNYTLPGTINKAIHVEGSSLLSNYMPDMQPILSSFKDNCAAYNGSSDNTYYLLFGTTNDADLLGYMPRARNTGFIFSQNNVTSAGDIAKAMPRTIAHELGHGAFNLKHIFSSDELGEGNKGQTDNLMDYTITTRLYKYQWDLIHNPGFVGWFEGDDDEAASQFVSTLTFLEDYANKDGSYTFLSNGLVPLTLPKTASYVRFSTADSYVFKGTSQVATYSPIGTLLSFYIGQKFYEGYGAGTAFVGYKTKTNEVYSESLTSVVKPTEVLIPMSYYEDGKTGLNFVKVKYDCSSVQIGNEGTGNMGITNVAKAVQLVENQANSGKFQLYNYEVAKVKEGITWPATFMPALTPAAFRFLESNKEFASLSSAIAPIIIAHAHQIATYPINERCQVKFVEQVAPRTPTGAGNAGPGSNQQKIESTILYDKIQTWKNANINEYYTFETELPRVLQLIDNCQTGQQISTLFQTDPIASKYFCVYELLPAKQRIRALQLISQMSSMNEEEEEMVVNLTQNVVNNGQSPLIYQALKDNNYQLFYDLVKWHKWIDGMDNSDLDNFVQNVSQIVIANTTEDYTNYCVTSVSSPSSSTTNRCFRFAYEDPVTGNNYDYSDEYLSPGIMKIKQLVKNSNGDYYPFSMFEGGPFDMVRFTFPGGNSIKMGELKGGEEFFAPAFYGAWLTKRYKQSENMFAVRIIVDGVVVVSAVASGGASAPLLVVDGVFAGTDLVITLAKDKLEESDEGKEFLETWDNIYILAGTTALPGLGEKILTANFYKFTFKVDALLTKIQSFTYEAKMTSIEQFNAMSEALASYVSKLNKLSVSNLLKVKLIYKLSEIKLISKTRNVVQSWGLKLKNNIIAVAYTANSEFEIGTVAFRGGTDLLELKEGVFIEGITVNGQVITRLENVRYSKPYSYTTKAGDLELVSVTENGVTRLVVREAVSTSVNATTRLDNILAKPGFNGQNGIFNKLPKNTISQQTRYASLQSFRDRFISLYDLNNTGLKSLDDVLNDFDNLVTNFHSVSEVERYVDELMQSASKFKGGAYGLEVLSDLPPSLNGKTLTGFEASIDDLADGVEGCRFDMRFADGSEMIFVETKNYAQATSFTPSFYNQFKSYMSQASSIEEIRYFFRSNAGVTRAERITKFKTMINSGTRGDEIFNSMSNTLKQELGLTGLNGRANFTTLINNETSIFYNFIEVL